MEKDDALNTLAKVFHNGEEMEGEDGAVMVVDLALWNEGCDAIEALIGGGGDDDDAARLYAQRPESEANGVERRVGGGLGEYVSCCPECWREGIATMIETSQTKGFVSCPRHGEITINQFLLRMVEAEKEISDRSLLPIHGLPLT